MRTIKFRAKTFIGKEWKYGDLHQRRGLAWNDYYIIENDVTNINLVDPETVGQFTGLLDNNGKKIYEGDIVLVKSDVFDDEYAVVEWEELPSRYILRIVNDYGYLLPLDCRGEMIVIGNIYDNPEMLKGCKQ